LAGRYKRLVADQECCVYCGARATTVDHFAPVSVVATIMAIGDLGVTGRFLVPACGECNRVASDHMFRSIGAKRRYIQARLQQRWKHILAIPLWSEDELAEMEWLLQRHVRSGLEQKAYIEARLQWRNSMNAEPARLAAVRFNVVAHGPAIVRRDVVKPPPVAAISTNLNSSNEQPALALIDHRHRAIQLEFNFNGS
jgi:hypothetical protein